MDGQQTDTPEPNKHSGHVDGFQTATTEDRTGDVVNRSDRGHGHKMRTFENAKVAKIGKGIYFK